MPSPAMHYLPAIDESSLNALLTEWRGHYPAMGVLVLLPEQESPAVSLIQSVCTRLEVPLIGAIFPALIAHAAFRTEGAWVLRFNEMPYAALFPELPLTAEEIPQRLGEIVEDIVPHLDNEQDVTLFMLFDAMVPNIGTLLDEFYLRLANRVHYMGANAGSESFQPMPCLFDATHIIQNGVAIMLLHDHHGAILEHGYGMPPKMITATSTDGNRIIQIDWQPAFDVYREMARVQYGIEINRDNFYQYAVHFPFGIVRANGIVLVRIPVALEEDGSLFCVGEVPPNAVLSLLEAPAVDSTQTLQTLTRGLEELNGPLQGRELLFFFCAGRRLHLGIEAATRELAQFSALSNAAEIAGVLSLGEIGSTTQWGYPLFHNATLVGSLWNGG